MNSNIQDLEIFAFEGISIDFQFNTDKPKYGDLFLLVGFENPNFSADNKKFEKLQDLGFEQTDDFFGIKNHSDQGDDVQLWLFPIVNGEAVYHNVGPFDAIRLTYIVLRNEVKTVNLLEKSFNSIISNLDVTPIWNGKTIESWDEIKIPINKTIQYCREELKVEPGSNESLQLDW